MKIGELTLSFITKSCATAANSYSPSMKVSAASKEHLQMPSIVELHFFSKAETSHFWCNIIMFSYSFL